ncbi:hypothetical protein VP01_3433g2 [Puccinia sorghi]|uniref:Uncharacterized protein n=1 Tax=Puccinia sorghi TaxID=27349 RepID=A0A0L6UY86_9BASI|nr:hypothetical protein VP01_3433g2 [Puccinia sorghi]
MPVLKVKHTPRTMGKSNGLYLKSVWVESILEVQMPPTRVEDMEEVVHCLQFFPLFITFLLSLASFLSRRSCSASCCAQILAMNKDPVPVLFVILGWYVVSWGVSLERVGSQDFPFFDQMSCRRGFWTPPLLWVEGVPFWAECVESADVSWLSHKLWDFPRREWLKEGKNQRGVEVHPNTLLAAGWSKFQANKQSSAQSNVVMGDQPNLCTCKARTTNFRVVWMNENYHYRLMLLGGIYKCAGRISEKKKGFPSRLLTCPLAGLQRSGSSSKKTTGLVGMSSTGIMIFITSSIINLNTMYKALVTGYLAEDYVHKISAMCMKLGGSNGYAKYYHCAES